MEFLWNSDFSFQKHQFINMSGGDNGNASKVGGGNSGNDGGDGGG